MKSGSLACEFAAPYYQARKREIKTMGWTSFNGIPSGKSTEDVLRDEFTVEGQSRSTLEDVEIVGSVAYCVVGRKATFCVADPNGDRFETETEKSAIVILVERTGNGIRYKNMHECMEPYYYDAPASILDQLSDTDEPCAIEWRRVCRENLASS